MESSRQRALELAGGLASTPKNVARVGAATSPEAARWAFLQGELRARAKAKFALADRMLFTREALEQATHERVAAYHASCFPPGATVFDMTAGIGADLIALARRGPAIGFELDSERASYARHNLLAHGLQADVREADSLAEWTDPDSNRLFAFADPSRRVEGRRTLDPDRFEPHPSLLAEMMATMRLGGIKLSPLLPDSYLESLGGRLEFVSFGGECREALVWLGKTAKPGRFAIHVQSGEMLPAGEPPPQTDEPGEFIFDCDPAAIRAHALGALPHSSVERSETEEGGRGVELLSLGDSNGYLTGPSAIGSPWLRSYRVLYYGPGDLKRTKAALKALDADTPVLKQRGTGLDLISLQKSLQGGGRRQLVLLCYPVGKGVRHIVAEKE